jgi:translation initiation factor IF-2
MAKKTKQAKPESNRVPVVSILGHVDHGKTTILDKIRETDVQLQEEGGITQKISVFTVDVENKGLITFVDTPGHEAFDLMRSRGGIIADIVLLIVAANDGVQPQTKESIEIIKNSPAKPIVVINKIDLPDVNLEAIRRDISKSGLEIEGLGGDIPVVEVSGETGKGIPELLDTIITVSEIEGLIDRGELPQYSTGRGFVLESVKDQFKGFVASIIAVQGEFKKANTLVYRKDDTVISEKIKGFIAEDGSNIDNLSEGHGGKILGLSAPIDLGTEIYATTVTNKKELAELEKLLKKEELESEKAEKEEMTDEDLLAQMFAVNVEEQKEEDEKKLNVILKSSSEGSLEAIKKSLADVNVDGYTLNLLTAEIGDVTYGDIERAAVTKSIVLAFEVAINNDAASLAKEKRVLVREYSIIYKIVEEVTDALTVMATPKEIEEDLGEAEIREIFVLTNGKQVLGGRVKSGIMKKKAKCYIVRDDEIIGTGKIVSLRHGKNEVNEAQKGADFGAMVEPAVEAQVGDEINCFKVVKQVF